MGTESCVIAWNNPSPFLFGRPLRGIMKPTPIATLWLALRVYSIIPVLPIRLVWRSYNTYYTFGFPLGIECYNPITC